MKRLLLGPVALAPLAFLGFCSFHTPKLPEVPKVPDVVRQIPLDEFNAFPPVTHVAPRKPVVRHQPKHQVKPHAPVGARPRTPLPPIRPAEELVPQQGPICIFPLNFIPNCKPQEVN